MARHNIILLVLIIALLITVKNFVNCATFENVEVILTTDYTRNINVDGQRPMVSVSISSANFLKNHVNNQRQSLESLVIVNQVIPTLTFNSVADLRTIERINITSSGVRAIEAGAFQNIPKLEMLIIENNEIEVIRSGTFSQLSVNWLSLKHNKISQIEDGAFANNLKHLELDYNRISAFDSEWSKNVMLDSLYMSYNLIKELPSKFMGSKKRIANIILNSNKIQKVAIDAFSGLQSINYLKLSDNLISHLPVGVFNDVQEIGNLELDNNKINVIQEDLFKNVDLTYVDLSSNLLKCVPINAMAKVYKFDIEDNPLTCDCVKLWEDWKREHNNNKIVNLKNFLVKQNCQKE